MLAACAALALAAPTSLFATTDFTIQNFDADVNGTGSVWGPGTCTLDSAVDDTGNLGGSLYISTTFSSGSDTPLIPYICAGGGNPWHYIPVPINFSTYASVEFDIKWDPTSTLTIAEFNDLSTYPSSDLPSWGPTELSGSTPGIEVGVAWTNPNYSWAGTELGVTNIPAGAATGWAHVSIPINPSLPNIDGQAGIYIHKWINNNWAIIGSRTFKVWIDNVYLKGTTPPAKPTVSLPSFNVTPGLNVFFSTASSAYDRQSAVLRQTAGLSWVGHATSENPVSYSFTIVGYPNSVNCEAWMYLVPNPAYMDNAPDWNETNCAIFYIQGSSTGATGHFEYKVGEAGGQDMYSGGGSYTAAPGTGGGITPESGNLAQVTNATTGVFGTWTLTFTSDTAGTLSSPDHTNSFTFPLYNATKFAENNPVGFYIYLGGQANNADAYNQPVVYSNFAVSGPVAAAYSENFLTDTVLDTTNIWTTSAASGPHGILIVPAADSGARWIQWSLPAIGYSLEASATLTGGSLAWTSPSINKPISMYGDVVQLVAPSELPAGDAAFFRLIQRTFTKLQILLPGEVAAPNTLTGKTTATPTPVSLSAGGNEDVTVNAVDDNWNIVSSSDTINLTCSDELAILPLATAMSGGTVTFSGVDAIGFSTEGSQTIMATDAAPGSTIPKATSAPVTVGP
jgi:hypothetical protein